MLVNEIRKHEMFLAGCSLDQLLTHGMTMDNSAYLMINGPFNKLQIAGTDPVAAVQGTFEFWCSDLLLASSDDPHCIRSDATTQLLRAKRGICRGL